MKRPIFFFALLLAIPAISYGKNNVASEFIQQVHAAAEKDAALNTSLDVECPAKSASGRVLLSKVSYDYGKSIGAFVFKNSNVTPANLTLLETKFEGDDFTSEVVNGYVFYFQIPNGQIFVEVNKDNTAAVGINKNGDSGISWIKCNIVKPD